MQTDVSAHVITAPVIDPYRNDSVLGLQVRLEILALVLLGGQSGGYVFQVRHLTDLSNRQSKKTQRGTGTVVGYMYNRGIYTSILGVQDTRQFRFSTRSRQGGGGGLRG